VMGLYAKRQSLVTSAFKAVTRASEAALLSAHLLDPFESVSRLKCESGEVKLK